MAKLEPPPLLFPLFFIDCETKAKTKRGKKKNKETADRLHPAVRPPAQPLAGIFHQPEMRVAGRREQPVAGKATIRANT